MCWQLFRDAIPCSHSPQSTYISPAVSVVAALCLTTSSAEASVFLQVLKSHYFLNWFINLYANVMVFQNWILNAGLTGFLFSFFYSIDQVEQVHKHCQKKTVKLCLDNWKLAPFLESSLNSSAWSWYLSTNTLCTGHYLVCYLSVVQ